MRLQPEVTELPDTRFDGEREREGGPEDGETRVRETEQHQQSDKSAAEPRIGGADEAVEFGTLGGKTYEARRNIECRCDREEADDALPSVAMRIHHDDVRECRCGEQVRGVQQFVVFE